MSYSSAHFLSTQIYLTLFALWQKDLFSHSADLLLILMDWGYIIHIIDLKSFHPSAPWHAYITPLSLFPLAPCPTPSWSFSLLSLPLCSDLSRLQISVHISFPFHPGFCFLSIQPLIQLSLQLRVHSIDAQGLHLIVSCSFSHYDTLSRSTLPAAVVHNRDRHF